MVGHARRVSTPLWVWSGYVTGKPGSRQRPGSTRSGTQMARRQHMIFHGTTGWLSIDASFNPGVHGPAQVHHHHDKTAEVTATRFDGVDQYRAIVEDFARTARGQTGKPAFPLENSLGNQRVIDHILSGGSGTTLPSVRKPS
ncbi:hypothetical protein Bxe_B0831 [Paraburkholderia xenovorans LB400]|uniref:Gfo/Idh/MocA-like oxidoreductase C-terminal domain-containing protein n=2 Tax=Paraburkholderia xenovorans TaxID=36873 RepID=Q13LB6_PARXL|nr:hypothetical protein Bxe_B0831 [Paraburkholderia xenovorans LB400]